MNILKPLYEACLDRMRAFVDDFDRLSEGKRAPDFRSVLAHVDQHPKREYFILKTIIIGNLYGVDIMAEACEITKLRLFLTLVAQVEDPAKLEPLPDIDFNIRAGNTLVGFTTVEAVRQAMTYDTAGRTRKLLLDPEDEAALKRIEEQAELAGKKYQAFQEMQTKHGMDAAALRTAKAELAGQLDALREELDRYLAREYGIAAADELFKYSPWRASHQPFHWFVEFYALVQERGGFDVIIGNPPWREYSAVRKEYTVKNYLTESTGNLYALCTERILDLRSCNGMCTFIVQLPLTSSFRMEPARGILRLRSNALYVIPFDDRPGKLFEGLQNCRSVIFISRGARSVGKSQLATSRYMRWPSEARNDIFPLIEFVPVQSEGLFSGLFPKYASSREDSIFGKVAKVGQVNVGSLLSRRATECFIFYQEATRYWVKATVGLPFYAKNKVIGPPDHGRYLYFDRSDATYIACALLNSSLFYSYFIAYGDCFHLSDGLVSAFPVPNSLFQDKQLATLAQQLMDDLKAQAAVKMIRTKDGDEISYAEYYGSRSKPIIDEIDRVLARHYGFTKEEQDFIINYDIKYRMGIENRNDDEGNGEE